ncbi:Similar to Acetylornithine aminotransferase, mitochondrial; acc. no. Q9P3I3 [Pyronema omphalodes CBS 100304]|uniref:acetylornithine transaminase n=1 Tax=Pyronema omphalodes (strain CBS 100304) TaxID=1076935 RepID=U4LFU8_PYROM|nr:Similar to Acetylornithine aminotransferase, mitochondrial; acc. no. Q9P3I3 [Pyronema omphalodes CBS 100304]
MAALRLSSKRLLSSTLRARYASTSSSLPPTATAEFSKEARLPGYDPPADSQSAALVSQHLPYMVATYARPPQVFTKGDGCYLFDIENRRYIDFNAGIAVNALGHNDEHLCNLIYDQAKQLMHVSNLYHNPWTGALSRLLVDKTVEAGGFHNASRAFICNSGSEANEAAIKFARKVGKVVGGEKKIGIVSFQNSFHGRTMGSLSATPNVKYQKPFGPMVPGFSYGKYNDVEAIDSLVTEETCGVIVEPIQGEGGIWVGSEEFFTKLRARCTEVGAVLIYDEIQSGIGRTGKLWAHQWLPKEAHPDIVTMAKALGNGFPIGATMVNEYVAEKIITGDHGTTYGGNPLASRVGHYVFERISKPEFLADVEKKSKFFIAQLEKLKAKYPEVISEIRGKGLILGAQLDRDPTEIVKACRERGLLVITAGVNTLRFVPPLVITEEVIEEGMKILDKALEAVVKK